MADDALERLCRQFALDPGAAREARAVAVGGDTPWYMLVLVGIGAWLAAVAMIGTAVQVVMLAADEESLPLLSAAFGFVVLGTAVTIHRRARGAFTRHFAVAGAVAGQTMIVGGLGWEQESLTLTAVAATVVSILLLPAIKDSPHQFLAAGVALGLSYAAMLVEEVPHAGGILVVITLPVALLLLVRPSQAIELRGLAYALLLLPVAAQSVLGVGGLGGDDWLARAAYAAGLIAMLAMLWRDAPAERRSIILAAGIVATLLGLVTAAGLLASLLLLAIAYLLGSRMLAVIGVAAHVCFLWQFYYDLELGLLEKSGMLIAAGLLLLALWWAWSRRAGAEAGDA